MPGTDRLRFDAPRVLALALTVICGMGLALVLAAKGDARGELFCDGQPADVTLTGNTNYTGTPNDDVVVGDSGEQEVHLRKGDDTLCGGGGDDDLHTGEGADDIFGESGNDQLRGKLGEDDLDGGFNGSTTDAATERGSQEQDICLGGRPRPDDPKGGKADFAFDCEQIRSAVTPSGK